MVKEKEQKELEAEVLDMEVMKIGEVLIKFPKSLTYREVEFLNMMLVAYVSAGPYLDSKKHTPTPSTAFVNQIASHYG